MTRIVVPIAAATAAELLAQARSARAAGADLVELRLDTCVAEGCMPDEAVATLPQLALPAIATARHAREGGSWPDDEPGRLRLLAEADRLGAAYVDVELAFDSGWRPARAQLILSQHDFQGMEVASMRCARPCRACAPLARRSPRSR